MASTSGIGLHQLLLGVIVGYVDNPRNYARTQTAHSSQGTIDILHHHRYGDYLEPVCKEIDKLLLRSRIIYFSQI